MSINWTLKRNDNGQTIDLHRQYKWSDEYGWTPIAQSSPVIMLSGAIDIQQGTLLANRPITLDSTHVWIDRQTVQQLQTWAAVPELTFTLTHPDGRTFNVMFRAPFIDNVSEIKPVRPEDELPTDKMKANIHFRTV
jgi:hypothetical protein